MELFIIFSCLLVFWGRCQASLVHLHGFHWVNFQKQQAGIINKKRNICVHCLLSIKLQTHTQTLLKCP